MRAYYIIIHRSVSRISFFNRIYCGLLKRTGYNKNNSNDCNQLYNQREEDIISFQRFRTVLIGIRIIIPVRNYYFHTTRFWPAYIIRGITIEYYTEEILRKICFLIVFFPFWTTDSNARERNNTEYSSNMITV